MDLKSIFIEIDGLNKELTLIRKKSTALNKRKKELEKKILEILEETEEQSVTHNGKTFTVDEKNRYARKGDKKRHQDIIKTLNDADIYGDDAEEMCATLLQAFHGPEKTIRQLKQTK